jgi:leishmanolysin
MCTSMFASVVTLTFALALVPALAHLSSVGPQCMHDDPQIQSQQQKLLARPPMIQSYTPKAATVQRRFSARSAQPLRIVFSYDDLRADGHFCAKVGDVVFDHLDEASTIQCANDGDVLTDEKRDILMNKILPAAAARLQRFISVEPVQGNLVMPDTDVCGSNFITPASHASVGIPDADVVIYIAASPIAGSTVAFAGSCRADQHGRAIAGRLNFEPEQISWSKTDDSYEANNVNIDVAVHEMLHVLGVSSTELNRADRSFTTTKRGKAVRLNTAPSVTAWARRFTGCDTLEGAEIEDEGATLSTGSHWERKLYMEEAMCAVVGSKISGLTLGFLHDLDVGYTINFNEAENMDYGRATGCGVHDFTCNTIEGGKDKYYCFDDPGDGSATACTPDLKSIGFCEVTTYTDPLLPQFQYFSNPRFGGRIFMDGCPVVIPFSNRQCSVPSAGDVWDMRFGYQFDVNSRCYADTQGVVLQGISQQNTDGPRCLVTQCTADGRVQFRLPGTDFVTCSGAPGEKLRVPDPYLGTVTCPDAKTLCATIKDVAPAVLTPAPFETKTTTTTTVPPTAPPPTDALPPTTPAPRRLTTQFTPPVKISDAPSTAASSTAPPPTPPRSTPPPPTPPAPTPPTTRPPPTPPRPTPPPPTPAPPTSPPRPTPPGKKNTPAPTRIDEEATEEPVVPEAPGATSEPSRPPPPTPTTYGGGVYGRLPTTSAAETANDAVSATVTVSGPAFVQVLAAPDGRDRLYGALASDLASLLSVASDSVTITQMSASAYTGLSANYSVRVTSAKQRDQVSARARALQQVAPPLPSTSALYSIYAARTTQLTIVASGLSDTMVINDAAISPTATVMSAKSPATAPATINAVSVAIALVVALVLLGAM